MRRNVVAGWHACHAASHLARLRAIVRRRLVGAAVVLALWCNDTIAECAVVEVGRGMCARGSSAAASSSIVLQARPPPLFARSTSVLAYSAVAPRAPLPPRPLLPSRSPLLPPSLRAPSMWSRSWRRAISADAVSFSEVREYNTYACRVAEASTTTTSRESFVLGTS